MGSVKIFLMIVFIAVIIGCSQSVNLKDKELGKELVFKHAKAWETGDVELLSSILHEDVVFAYPGRRLNKTETMQDFIDYNKSFKDTKIYIINVLSTQLYNNTPIATPTLFAIKSNTSALRCSNNVPCIISSKAP